MVIICEHLFTVIIKVGVVYTMLLLKDTHKLWISCSLQIPSYWIKLMRMGYGLWFLYRISCLFFTNEWFFLGGLQQSAFFIPFLQECMVTSILKHRVFCYHIDITEHCTPYCCEIGTCGCSQSDAGQRGWDCLEQEWYFLPSWSSAKWEKRCGQCCDWQRQASHREKRLELKIICFISWFYQLKIETLKLN